MLQQKLCHPRFPTWELTIFAPPPLTQSNTGLTSSLQCDREGAVMRRIWAVVFCGGAGFWLDAHYQVPQWGLWSLLVLGTLAWGLANWMEWREARKELNRDQAR